MRSQSVVREFGMALQFQAAGLAGGGHSHVNMNPHHNQQPGVNMGETYDPSYCSVKLPSPQPLAPMDSPVLER